MRLIMNGRQQVIKSYLGDKLLNPKIAQDNLVAHYEAFSKKVIHLRSRNVWNDDSGENNHLSLIEPEFNTNAWMNNTLRVTSPLALSAESNITVYGRLTYQMGFVIPNSGNILFTLPGIESISTSGRDLHIQLNSNSDILTIVDFVDYNRLTQLDLVIISDELYVYKNNILLNKFIHITDDISTTSKIYIGKTVIVTRECNFDLCYLLLYNTSIGTIKMIANNKYLYPRYLNYYLDNLILDIRGRDTLIYQGDKIYIKDNSVRSNHIITDILFSSKNKDIFKKTYLCNGYNRLTCAGRKLIHEEFTIELTISGIQERVIDKTFLLGNFSSKSYGFRVGLSNSGFIVEMANSEGDILVNHDIDYTNKEISFAITYKDKQLSLYINGTKMKIENIEYTNFYTNLNLFFAKQDTSWDGYRHKINNVRIYSKAIDDEHIKNNHNVDLRLNNI